MKTVVQVFFPLFFLCLLILGCSQSSQLTSKGDADLYKGQLTVSDYQSLKQYLLQTSGTISNDTIFIKYDYNNETCWSRLDQENDEHIMGFVTRSQKRIEDLKLSKQNCSFFSYREPGKNLNKIKKWDSSITIDSSKQLFNLIFKKRYECGSSVIVLPNRKYIFIKNDPHSTGFGYTSKQIEDLLNMN